MPEVSEKKLIGLKDLPGPKGLPLIGNVHKITIDDLHNDVAGWALEYGGVYRLRLGITDLTVVTKPSIIQEILRQRPKEIIRMSKMDRVIREQNIHGVFNAEGDDWKVHRSIVAKGLDVRHQEQFFPYMLTCVERLFTKWNESVRHDQDIDIQQDFLRFTVDVTTYLAFAYELNTIEEKGGVIQDHLEKIFPMIFKRINDPIPWYKIWKTAKDKEFDVANEEINKLVNTFIENGRKRIQVDPGLRENPSTVLEAILVAAETEDDFGDDEVRGNLITLLMAGEDTTAHTLAWGIYLLTKPENQHVLNKLEAEIDSVLGDDPWMIDYADRTKFPYLEAVTNEIMRLKPVAPIMLNEPTQDLEIEGYLFKKGAHLLIQTRVGATADENFTDPQIFNPDRWLAVSKCPVHNVQAFMPFGAGPRFCPGRNLAILEIKLVFGMLFKNFKVELTTKHEDVNEIMAFTMMASDYQVKLTPRSN